MFCKRRMILPMLLLGLLLFGNKACAAEADYAGTGLTGEGVTKLERLNDGDSDTYRTVEAGGTIQIYREDGIHAIYIEFDRIPECYEVVASATGERLSCGENGFLHEYIDVAGAFSEMPQMVELTFEKETVIADIYAFSEGELPDWVQIWQPPCEEADLLLISSHSDDEQLFFAGILPYYAVERELKVQVAYIIQHFEVNGSRNHQRPHEQLDGLWAVGVRNYPIMSDFPDLYAESKDRQTAFKQASAVFEKQGITYDDFIAYITECLRRFKPLVVVSHDLDGEYGHGTHVLCAAALTEAIEYATDENMYPESAEKYGTWQVEKTYLHLYEENPIVMNFDVPLESFGGKTAFEVTQDGFACHKSQHWTWFYKWIYGTADRPITKATDIRKYSPCKYGLYDTKVGADIVGGDFFENVVSYEERAIIAAKEAEELARQEAERLRLEEEERLRLEEEARKEKEEWVRNLLTEIWPHPTVVVGYEKAPFWMNW